MFVACPLMTISTCRVRHFFRLASSVLEKPGHCLIQRVVGLGNVHHVTPFQAHVFRAIAGLEDRAEINGLLLPAFLVGSGAANAQVRKVRKRQVEGCWKKCANV